MTVRPPEHDNGPASGAATSHPIWWGRLLYDLLWVLCRLDPLLLGLATDRRLSSLARSSLFNFGPFGRVITALDAIPINREASTVQAMKAVIGRLRGGAAVIVFPEGTRTADGHLGEIKSGFALLAKRGRVPIAPVAIVGAYECWPRSRLLPRPGRVRLEFGPVITAAEVADLDERQLVARCSDALRAVDRRARQLRSG